MYENRIMIKYTLEDAHSETTLRFRPFLAFRNVNELTHANNNLNQSYTEITNGIKTCMYAGYPDIYMQFSKKVKFVYNPYWYNGIEYPKEQERGYPYQEDLYVPGYFEVPIKKGESIIFSAGDTQVATTKLKTLFDKEIANRTPRTSFFNCLKNSAQQFFIRPNANSAYLLAGYPWFKVRARDLFVSLPGCTLSINDIPRFEQVMNTAIPALHAFMEENKNDDTIQEIDNPDVLLWAVWAIQQYAKECGIEQTKTLYLPIIEETISYICSQKHPYMRLTDNGLLFADGKDKAITWMNSTTNGKPVVPRTGYIVEFNALWYNALCFYKELKGDTDKQIDDLINKINVSFPETFINGYNYLFDYVNGSYIDWSVRPNMIFAVSLTYSPLTRLQKRAVLDIVTKELLTPKGIRSLSPKSEGYRPYCTGPQYERDLAYHQGTAWPWLLGAYLEGYLRVFGKSGVAFAERMLISMEEEMGNHCIGTIAELFDGNPPFTGRGAISFAMNVAAMLRILNTLEKYNVE